MNRSIEPAGARSGPPPRRIGDVAGRFGVHPQTLRLYERAGLLRPGRSSGNVRRYDDDDLERLATILKLTRERGVNLAGVAIILQLLEQIDKLERRLEPWPQGGPPAVIDLAEHRRTGSAGRI